MRARDTVNQPGGTGTPSRATAAPPRSWARASSWSAVFVMVCGAAIVACVGGETPRDADAVAGAGDEPDADVTGPIAIQDPDRDAAAAIAPTLAPPVDAGGDPPPASVPQADPIHAEPIQADPIRADPTAGTGPAPHTPHASGLDAGAGAGAGRPPAGPTAIAIRFEDLLAASPSPGVPTSRPPRTGSSADSLELDRRQRRTIEAWFRRVGEVRPDEDFGALVARAAKARLGTPYAPLPEPKGEERLTVKADGLDCLTLIESSNAIARCIWAGAPDVACFVHELRETRYREGKVDGYASRLHYFEDWMYDNARRARVRPLIDELGLPQLPADLAEAAGRRDFDFMTQHPRRYPALTDPTLREAIARAEARLSRIIWPVLPKEQIPDILEHLRDGDIVGFVKGTPGLGVGHTGLVSIDRHGRPRVLHSTDRSGHVSLSACDLASCEARRSDRVGMIVMRPLPPPRGGDASPSTVD